MIVGRQWAALCVPFGVVAGHTIAYLLAHPGAADRARALGSMHAHVGPLAVVGAVAMLAALVAAVRVGFRAGRVPVTVAGLAACQVVVFSVMEVSERVAAGGDAAAAVREPALWIGVVVQLAVVGVARWLLRVAEVVGAAIRARRPRHRDRPAIVRVPLLPGVGRRAPLTPWSRRGPPAGVSALT